MERLEACEDRHHVDALAAAMAACLPEVDMMGGSSSATEPAPGAESAAADAETARTTSSMRVCRGLEPSPGGSTWPRPRPPFPPCHSRVVCVYTQTGPPAARLGVRALSPRVLCVRSVLVRSAQ